MLRIKSNTTGLVQDVTPETFEQLKKLKGRNAFKIVSKDTVPEEVKALQAEEQNTTVTASTKQKNK